MDKLKLWSDEFSGIWIQTFTGKKFNPLAPWETPDGFDIIDVAHALSMQCRYSGHVHRHYSVCEHAIRVAIVMESIDQKNADWGLSHDDSEAYLVDLASPIKRVMPIYKNAENILMHWICEKLGLCTEEPPMVKIADKFMLAVESRDLLGPLIPGWGHKCFEGTPEEWIERHKLEELWEESKEWDLMGGRFIWTPQYAKERFLEEYDRLFNQKKRALIGNELKGMMSRF